MLLTTDNAKTSKGFKMGYYTGVLYLAPHVNSGVTNVCPLAEIAGCNEACLYRAGRGRFNAVQEARVKKTRYFHDRTNEFMNELARDIQRIMNTASRLEMTPLIRLNGTSDILWECTSVSFDEYTAKYLHTYGKRKVEVGKVYRNLMEVFPDVQFYDYTKIATRVNLPENYDLTFSYSGTERYQRMVERARRNNMRIAVVFRKKDQIPKQFLGMNVVDGDDTDIRHLDPQGVVVSLYAKGPAVKDNTGFVVDIA